MAGEAHDNIWPAPKLHVKVVIDGGIMASFQEVSGLDAETDIIEYRHGEGLVFSTVKMPWLRKSSDITLRRGIFEDVNKFRNWFNEIEGNIIERKTVTIMLLNESGESAMAWTLTDAFPKQVKETKFGSTNGEAAIETLVLAHEGLSIATP